MPQNSKIRVLQLGMPTGLYGAERWILALINNLDLDKIHPIVGVINDDPTLNEIPLCREAARCGFHTEEFYTSLPKLSLDVVRHLRTFIRKTRIHVLHTHGYKSDLIGLLASRGTGCRVVATPHGWSKQADWKLWCYEMIDRAILPFFDSVVPLSEKMYQNIKKIPGIEGKLQLIQNGVDLPELSKAGEVAGEIRKLKDKNAFVIGYIGRLISSKGVDVLLKALAGLNSIEWHAVLIGEGDQQSELLRLAERLRISHRIHFMGYREDRLNFLKGFDVFVLPSRTEGIPRCLMEAMACGIPSVASNIPGCRYLVDGSNTGLLFEVDDISDLREKIKMILKDKQIQSHLAIQGRNYPYNESYTNIIVDISHIICYTPKLNRKGGRLCYQKLETRNIYFRFPSFLLPKMM